MNTSSDANSTLQCKTCPAWGRSAFAVLDEVELAKLQAAKEVLHRRRGETFSEKSQPADEVYCLASGSAKVNLTDKSNRRQSLVRLVEPGELLGYRCVFSADVYRGTARALTDSVTCKVSREFIFDLIQRQPKFAFEMLRRMGGEVEAAEDHHHSFCQKNVRERLAESLLILKRKFASKTAEGFWKIETRLTRNDLAEWIGSSRETVIRELTALTQEGLVQQSDDFLLIKNVEGLEKISGKPLSPPSESPSASL